MIPRTRTKQELELEASNLMNQIARNRKKEDELGRMKTSYGVPLDKGEESSRRTKEVLGVKFNTKALEDRLKALRHEIEKMP